MLLGSEAMDCYNLKLPQSKWGVTSYDPIDNHTISNEFATVAYRFGRSIIPSVFFPSSDPIRSNNHCPLKDNFFKFEEYVIESDSSGKAWQNLLLGIINQQSPAMDASITITSLTFYFVKTIAVFLVGLERTWRPEISKEGGIMAYPHIQLLENFAV